MDSGQREVAQTAAWPQQWAHFLIRSFGMPLLFVGAALIPELFFVKRFFPYPFLFLFFGAVMASAWFGGMAGGLLAVVASILAVDYFFIPPVYSFVFNAAAGLYLASFVVCALVASWVSSAQKKSEEALKEARDELESRVSERTAALMKTEGELAELTASIAHEIKQPLTAVVTHGHACLEWLSANPPNLDKARQTTERIIQEGTRAGAVLSRIRALFKKEIPLKDWLETNEVIHEVIVLLRQEALKRQISIRTDLAPGLPKIKADRVQLQQVVLNLMMNAMDAVSHATDSRRELLVRSRRGHANEILVQIEDTGVGLSPETAGKIFEPFFTTKAHGIGMGLAISRSIIESHDGKLWATPRPSGGAIFQFTVPVSSRESDG
jgi:signal transduction histidine kinase